MNLSVCSFAEKREAADQVYRPALAKNLREYPEHLATYVAPQVTRNREMESKEVFLQHMKHVLKKCHS